MYKKYEPRKTGVSLSVQPLAECHALKGMKGINAMKGRTQEAESVTFKSESVVVP